MKIIEGKILDTNYDLLNRDKRLDENLAAASVRGLSKHSSEHHIYDASFDKSMNNGTFLALCLALAKYFRREFPDDGRLGIALPSGIAGNAANVACQMAGKVSVNINFTMGASAAAACFKKADVKTVISADMLRAKIAQKIPDFPWPDRFFDISKILKKIGKAEVVKNLLAVKLLPASAIIRLYKIPTSGGDREASIIFTSGSEGDPKAAVLTHKNIMGNCLQMEATGIVTKDTVLHSNLPLFHSFGQSIQVWLTSIFAHKTVAAASPLEVKQNFDAIQKGKSTIMISTPTFLRSYLKKGDPKQIESLKFVIAGAEKSPDGFKEMWEEKFANCQYKEGYGLTEASPVVAVNLPEGLEKNKYRDYETQTRAKAVGQLFAGMQAAILNPDTGEFLPIGETGLLCLKGANVFGGYLNAPELNAEKFKDGWLITGDLASLDSDGFVYIKGRLSRFSKIGGEMVPHALVEERIIKALKQECAEKPTVAIGSRESESKGEELVLITTLDITPSDLRRELADFGLANLWIPKVVIKVDEIPTLATGKLNLGEIRKIAKDSKK
ncbi:MAG: AMP-binding protein [Opitutales bacterium]|nr:AMP-binding protein [Opitutales bacterium]